MKVVTVLGVIENDNVRGRGWLTGWLRLVPGKSEYKSREG